MIPKWVVLHKKRGQTPLDVLSAYKAIHPELSDVPMSYAGRLDPMAEGKLLVLIGDECKRQDTYTKLDKEYEIEVLLGVKTDTGDVLGIPTTDRENGKKDSFLNSNETNLSSRFLSAVRDAIKHEVGSHSRKYPVFSSRTVNGKPLFLYSLEGTLDTITIPEHIETIYRIKDQGSYQLTKDELRIRISKLLADVPRSDEPSKVLGADFRQDEVRARWEELLKGISDQKFTILKLRIICGSGSYMRTLAERIGKSLGTNSLALSINRTKIGMCSKWGAVICWIKAY